MTYLVLRLYVCLPIQEEGDGGMVTIEGSFMEGSLSILQQDGQTYSENKRRIKKSIRKLVANLAQCNLTLSLQCMLTPWSRRAATSSTLPALAACNSFPSCSK